MTQKDYILRIAEDVGQALAQIFYHKKIRDYQGALFLVDELFNQTVGADSGFIHAISVETLLAMLSLHGALNVEKALLIATLFKAEGDIYEDQGNPDAAYDSYLTSLNLFLEIILCEDNLNDLRCSAEVEDLLGKLEVHDLPVNTRCLRFQFYLCSGVCAIWHNHFLTPHMDKNSARSDAFLSYWPRQNVV